MRPGLPRWAAWVVAVIVPAMVVVTVLLVAAVLSLLPGDVAGAA